VNFGLAMVAEQLIRIVWARSRCRNDAAEALKGAIIPRRLLFSRYRLLLLGIVALVLLRGGCSAQDLRRSGGARRHPAARQCGGARHQAAALHDRDRGARRRDGGGGGALFAPITIGIPRWWSEIITVAFVVVVIGGLGSFWGVVLARAARRRGARHHRSISSRPPAKPRSTS